MSAQLIRTDGAELRIDDRGRDEPALVFLHYWGGSSRTWAPVVERLPTTARTVAVDQRGWGGSRATDGRHGLQALADDVVALVEALGIRRYVLVGHSMGGKAAMLVAGRRPPGLAGLVLVAPAPPTPMGIPPEVRAGMLASYQSRDGVLQALAVLAGPTLDERYREQVIEDTLCGDADAKRCWPEQGMSADISAAVEGLALPIDILVGEHDQVERASVLRAEFSRLLPSASFTVVPGAGHLMPLEAPQAIASRCERMVRALHRK